MPDEQLWRGKSLFEVGELVFDSIQSGIPRFTNIELRGNRIDIKPTEIVSHKLYPTMAGNLTRREIEFIRDELPLIKLEPLLHFSAFQGFHSYLGEEKSVAITYTVALNPRSHDDGLMALGPEDLSAASSYMEYLALADMGVLDHDDVVKIAVIDARSLYALEPLNPATEPMRDSMARLLDSTIVIRPELVSDTQIRSLSRETTVKHATPIFVRDANQALLAVDEILKPAREES